MDDSRLIEYLCQHYVKAFIGKVLSQRVIDAKLELLRRLHSDKNVQECDATKAASSTGDG